MASDADSDGVPGPGVTRVIGEYRLHVLDEGRGPPLLLMAALGSNWFDLDPLANRLVARGWRVIRYDRPGYGRSIPVPAGHLPTLTGEVARMSAVLDALGVRQPTVLVGHSMASLYVEGFARTHPSRTAGVVMLDGSYVMLPWRVVPGRWRARNAHRLMDRFGPIARRLGWPPRGRGQLRTRILPTPPEGFDAAQRYWGDRYFGGSMMVRTTLVENAAFPTVNATLRRLRRYAPLPPVPVVVVAALSGSPVWQQIWLAKQRRYAAALGGRLRTVAARHFLVLEVPEEVAELIDEMHGR
ncbi:alpha/beta hydrolase [Gordonia sp. ABSL1-1]|uniref:alpha/beta fold hydrolase n=1 Tax=Gordonia sp. ABSL1-1 TaxID=3053923 RepID=UPI00257479DD|nr:alpha/beta hydrolase [Gordonia sp. ABSL1-1]MDL9935387.1 alpha/beta hydrolase [Gordonia sp. ABSL1-1]